MFVNDSQIAQLTTLFIGLGFQHRDEEDGTVDPEIGRSIAKKGVSLQPND